MTGRRRRTDIDIVRAAELVSKGQERAWSILGKMIDSGSLPATLLFTGPVGAGKELAAMRLAAMLECERDGACGVCPACGLVSSLEHPDVHPVYAVPQGDRDKNIPVIIESRREDFLARGEFGGRARSIGIEQIRQVIEKVSKQPFSGPSSVVAVMEADKATTEAQNAFLKLLEEPPASARMVLVTARPDLLLPTVVSRCSEVRFDPLPEGVIAEFLVSFVSVEGGEAARVAGMADGSLQRAVRLLDGRFLALRDDALSMIGLVLEGKARALPGEAQTAAHNYSRDEVGELFSEMTAVMRDLMRGKAAGLSPEAVEAASERDIPADIRKIYASMRSLSRNADTELTLAQLLLDLAGRWY